jgi:competence protein ComEA
VQLTIAIAALCASLFQAVWLRGLLRQEAGRNTQANGRRIEGVSAGRDGPLIQIDLNRAQARELTLLPGVGAVLARRIVENRNRLGPFESVDALARVDGIGDKTIERIRPIGYVDRDPPRETGPQKPPRP